MAKWQADSLISDLVILRWLRLAASGSPLVESSFGYMHVRGLSRKHH